MSEQKHTPGPWSLNRITCSIGCCDDLHEVLAKYPEDSKPDRRVAVVDGGNAVWLGLGQSEANASLIAAAPDLLAACQAAVRCLESIERNESVILETIRKADPPLYASAVSTFEGWKRNLAHARDALASPANREQQA